MEFSWDEGKAEKNSKKHKVSFEEATEAFEDPHAKEFEDEKHSFTQ